MALQIYAKRYLPRPVVDVLRAFKYRYQLATFAGRIVSHRYGGHPLRMVIADRVGAEWYAKDWPMPAEIEFLSQQIIPRDGLVFDLGAHQCLIAMLLAREIVPDGSVVAVESNRHNAAVAERNLDLNGVDNVDVVNALVSNTTGKVRTEASFNSRARGGLAGAIGNDKVDGLSIDALAQLKGFPDLVFMDIEGFEIEALKGAVQTLARRCHWFVELHGDDLLSRYGARNSDIQQFFDYRDFACFVSLPTEDKFRPVTEREPLPSERCYLIFAPRSARLIENGTDRTPFTQ